MLALVIGLWWCWAIVLAPDVQSLIARRYAAQGRSDAPAVAPVVPAQAPASGVTGPTVPTRLSTSDYFQQLGQTGDLYGGVNALFASIAVVGVFWAGALQRRTMLEARQAIAQQQFETAFFELLRLTREVAERIETTYVVKSGVPGTPGDERHRRGSAALNALANNVFGRYTRSVGESDDADYLQKLVDDYKQRLYRHHPSALGPYWRLLYQTFTLVSQAPLSKEERLRYANIARGQLSEGAVLLLALNGLTWRGRKFVDHIERFGLLEHMHPAYLRRFKSYLLSAYRKHAFLGSKEREKVEIGQRPTPGPYAFDQDPDQPNFVITRPLDDDAEVDES